MHPNEKKLRYQDLQKLGRMKRDGAKPSTVMQLQRSIAGSPKVVQKAKVLRGKRG